jgi:large subunit ribosomal protein L24
MQRIRKGDEVIVIAGKDKGRQGTVDRVMADGKLIIQGINVMKKHQRPNPNAGVPGGIVDKEMPIEASNVMLYNPETGKSDRVGFKVLESGKKVRFFKSNNAVLDK